MDLATFISTRKQRLRLSLREMEQRARAADRPLSRSQISNYEHGDVDRPPTREVIEGLAAALDCTYAEVAAAVAETFGFGPAAERRTSQHSEAWLRLTAHRSEREVEELLLIVEQVLRMRDMERPNGGNSFDDVSG